MDQASIDQAKADLGALYGEAAALVDAQDQQVRDTYAALASGLKANSQKRAQDGRVQIRKENAGMDAAAAELGFSGSPVNDSNSATNQQRLLLSTQQQKDYSNGWAPYLNSMEQSDERGVERNAEAIRHEGSEQQKILEKQWQDYLASMSGGGSGGGGGGSGSGGSDDVGVLEPEYYGSASPAEIRAYNTSLQNAKQAGEYWTKAPASYRPGSATDPAKQAAAQAASKARIKSSGGGFSTQR